MSKKNSITETPNEVIEVQNEAKIDEKGEVVIILFKSQFNKVEKEVKVSWQQAEILIKKGFAKYK